MYDAKAMQEKLLARSNSDANKKRVFTENTLFEEDVEILKIKANTLYVFDIVPYIAGKKDPDKDIREGDPNYILIAKIHRNVGINYNEFFCPTNWGKPCPLCNERRSLKLKGVPDTTLKEYSYVIYNFINMNVHKPVEEAGKGVQILQIANFFFWKNIKTLLKDAITGTIVPIADPINGKTISFQVGVLNATASEVSGFQKYDRKHIIGPEILAQAKSLDNIMHIPEYDELADIFNAGRGKKNDQKQEPVSTPTSSVTSTNNPPWSGGTTAAPTVAGPTCPHGHNLGMDFDEMKECVSCNSIEVCRTKFKEIFKK